MRRSDLATRTARRDGARTGRGGVGGDRLRLGTHRHGPRGRHVVPTPPDDATAARRTEYLVSLMPGDLKRTTCSVKTLLGFESGRRFEETVGCHAAPEGAQIPRPLRLLSGHGRVRPRPGASETCAAAMALLALSDDALGVIFEGLRNTLDPRVLVLSSSTCKGLRALTQPLVQRLRADYEEATALCLKLGKRSCKELREAKVVDWRCTGFSAADLTLLGRLAAVLPALERLVLIEFSGSAGPDGVPQLTEGLIAGALPAVKHFILAGVPVGDAGASDLAAALDRGALPRLEFLGLHAASIGDAGLVALAPALRRRPALERIDLEGNPFGDEGLTALVAPPPPPAGAQPPPAGGLMKLNLLHLSNTQITNAGCAALVDALDGNTLPALQVLNLKRVPASAEAKEAVREAMHRSIFVMLSALAPALALD